MDPRITKAARSLKRAFDGLEVQRSSLRRAMLKALDTRKQCDLARDMGVSQPTITALLNGKLPPSQKLAERLSKENT